MRRLFTYLFLLTAPASVWSQSSLITYFEAHPDELIGKRTEVGSFAYTRQDQPLIECKYSPSYSASTFQEVVNRRKRHRKIEFPTDPKTEKDRAKQILPKGNDVYFDDYIQEFFRIGDFNEVLKSSYFIKNNNSKCDFNGLCFLNHVFNELSSEDGNAERLLILRDIYGVNASYLSGLELAQTGDDFSKVHDEISGNLLAVDEKFSDAVIPMTNRELDLLIEVFSEMPPALVEILTEDGSKPLRMYFVNQKLFDTNVVNQMQSTSILNEDGSYSIAMVPFNDANLTVTQIKSFIWMSLGKIIYEKLNISGTEWSDAGFAPGIGETLASTISEKESEFMAGFAVYRYAPYLYLTLGEKGFESRLKKYEMMKVIFNGEEYLSRSTCHNSANAETTNVKTYLAVAIGDEILNVKDNEDYQNIDYSHLMSDGKPFLDALMQHPSVIPNINERAMKTPEVTYWRRKKSLEGDPIDLYLNFIQKQILMTISKDSLADSIFPNLLWNRFEAERNKFFLDKEPALTVASANILSLHRKFLQYIAKNYPQVVAEEAFDLLYMNIYEQETGGFLVGVGKSFMKMRPVKTMSQLMNGEVPGIVKWGEKALGNMAKFFNIGEEGDDEDDEDSESVASEPHSADQDTGVSVTVPADSASDEDDEEDEIDEVDVEGVKEYSDEFIRYFMLPVLPNYLDISSDLVKLRKLDQKISDEENIIQLSYLEGAGDESTKKGLMDRKFDEQYAIIKDKIKEKNKEFQEALLQEAHAKQEAFKAASEARGPSKHKKHGKGKALKIEKVDDSESERLRTDLRCLNKMDRLLRRMQANLTASRQKMTSSFYVSRLEFAPKQTREVETQPGDKTIGLPLAVGIIGDSWATGFPFQKDDAEYANYTEIFSQRIQSFALPNGASIFQVMRVDGEDGETASNVMDHLQIMLDDQDIHVVMIELGGNDALNLLEHPETLLKSSEETFDRVKMNLQNAILQTTALKKYALLTKLETLPALKEKLTQAGLGIVTQKYDQIFTDLCRENQSNPYFYCLDSFMSNLTTKDFQEDHIHPNPAGHNKIANNLFRDFVKFYKSITQKM